MFCFDPSSLVLYQKLGSQFILKLLLMHLEILAKLYANEYQPYDKLWELKVGKYKIYKSSKYLRSNRFRRST
jgi:hypothetical protein